MILVHYYPHGTLNEEVLPDQPLARSRSNGTLVDRVMSDADRRQRVVIRAFVLLPQECLAPSHDRYYVGENVD